MKEHWEHIILESKLAFILLSDLKISVISETDNGERYNR